LIGLVGGIGGRGGISSLGDVGGTSCGSRPESLRGVNTGVGSFGINIPRMFVVVVVVAVVVVAVVIALSAVSREVSICNV
jgi:hypothetical protein